MSSLDYIYCFVSGFVGFFVGLSELASRYKSFNKVFDDKNSWLYLILNFLAGTVAYVIVRQYKLPLGPINDHAIGRIIACGLGAMAILRSSFFTFKDSSGKPVEVGPAALVTVFLKVAETQFDQEISSANITKVAAIVQGLNFISASKDLPIIVLGAMRVLSADEQKQISDDILKLINDNTITPEIKSVVLGLTLIKYTGEELLTTSVHTLKQSYQSMQLIINQIKSVSL